MNSPKTINHEYLPPTMRFIIAGAIAEFRNTASNAAKAKMAPAK